MEGKKVLKKLGSYQQGKQTSEIKLQYNLDRIVKLSSNENPYGFSENVKDNLVALTNDLHIYPDGYTGDLREALRTKLNVDENQLVFGAGSDELIQLICRTFLEPNTNTIMPTPTFSQYKHNSLIEGATIKEIPLLDDRHDLDGMLKAVDEETRVIWLCSPDNPTGTSLSKEAFYTFMDHCPNHVLVVLDEAYIEYMDEAKNLHALEHLDQYENLILLRTFSKAYGLAGLRVGYGIANQHIIEKINIVRGPFNTASISQKAAQLALEDQVFIQETTTKNSAVKKVFQNFLDQIGWKYYDSQTNFILVSTPVSGTDVFQYLLEHGFIVRPGEVLGFPNTIRITIGKQKDMDQLQQILTKLQMEINKEQ